MGDQDQAKSVSTRAADIYASLGATADAAQPQAKF